ncbi:ArdC family protein [Bacillus subtilis]|uniref:ArdC family protein n=1 Tax=Bacillus subtilis TaxID=1423 RepID=UPI0031F4B8FE
MSKVYDYVQDRIIRALEEAIENGGPAPWRKPWKGGMPKNYITKIPYRGINLLLLEGGSYLTFKQIQELQKKNPEVKLKKGSKSHKIYFWKPIERGEDEESEEDRPNFIFRYYNVFHASDVDGIADHDTADFINDPIESAEKVVSAYREECQINIKVGSDRAYYSPPFDSITVPSINQYKNVTEYYATVFHEMIHSTGHVTRLKRFDDDPGQTIFGSESYSKEELVAEIGANMILSMLGIEDQNQQKNSVSYLHNWLCRIKEDRGLIISASQHAQKASDFILNFVEGKDIENDLKLTEAI